VREGLLQASLEGSAEYKRCSNAACGRKGTDAGVELERCSGCVAELYCSRACQRAHWVAGHAEVCKKRAKKLKKKGKKKK